MLHIVTFVKNKSDIEYKRVMARIENLESVTNQRSCNQRVVCCTGRMFRCTFIVQTKNAKTLAQQYNTTQRHVDYLQLTTVLESI